MSGSKRMPVGWSGDLDWKESLEKKVKEIASQMYVETPMGMMVCGVDWGIEPDEAYLVSRRANGEIDAVKITDIKT